VLTRFRYDAWGKQTLTYGNNTGINATRQGHTSHEMLDGGLTHMNGRLYDPVLSRFVSADPTVDNPFDLQSLNRYSYVNNNPMGFTDPTGYFKIFGMKWSSFRDKVVKPVVAVVAAWYLGPMIFNSVGGSVWGAVETITGSQGIGLAAGVIAGGATAGAVTGAIAGGLYGGWNGALQGAKYGAIGGAIGGTVSAMYGNSWGLERVAANSLAGGVSSVAQGGSFSDGFRSSLIVSSLTYANYLMRQDQIILSKLNPNNASGSSAGFFGDRFSLAGARETLDDFFQRVACKSWAGGCQGAILSSVDDPKNLLGIPYSSGGFLDTLGESFAGPHDWLRNMTGAYLPNGNSVYFAPGSAGDIWDQIKLWGTIPLAAPFAASALIGTTVGIDPALRYR
jgi:RHS repeat-associated protein